MLRVHLFGGLTMAWGEQALPTPSGAAACSLLAYLLTYGDRPHSRDLLVGTFWPDLPESTARRRLSQALWQIGRLRQPALAAAVGEGALPSLLLCRGQTIQLHPDLPLWLDVVEFARLYAHSSGEGDQSLQAAAMCAELYRGEFLAGYYEDWIVPERERLREMFLQALGRLLEGHKARGEYESALLCARRLVAEDPWHEEANREVMRLCHLLGRDGEALQQYQACCQALAQDVGTTPAPETAGLAAEIAAQAGRPGPPLLPSAARRLPAPFLETPDRIPLVGRRRELAELLRQAEGAAHGSGGLVILYGEAGVGKTRLLRELAENAAWRGMRTAWGRCYELAAPPAYQPLLEALRAGLPALEALLSPLWRGELSRLLPELAGTEAPALTPEEERRRLLEAIARGFMALAESAPHLVLLEDAQWMDLASMEALRYLLPRLGESALLVVVSVRGEELVGRAAEAIAAIENTRLARRLELRRFDLAESGELLRRALGLEQPAPLFSARLYDETEGSPFFLLEALRALLEDGLLYRDAAGAWTTPWDDSTADYAEMPLPPGVVQVIFRRLERLPPAPAAALNTAAVIGREVNFGLWLAANGSEEKELLAAGDELVAHGLLRAGTGGADYTFAHDLIRRVAYQRLTAPHRRSLHRRVAEALARLPPGEPAALAYHWTQAEVWDRALEYQEQAGDRARACYAHAAAAAHYTRALEAQERLPGRPDPARRFRLRLARESAYALLGARSPQAEDLAALEALSAGLDDGGLEAAGRRAEVALRRARYAAATGDYAAAIAAAQAAIALAGRAADRGQEATAYLCWGDALWHRGAYTEARIHLEHALGLAQQARLKPIAADGYLHLGQVFLAQGDYAQAGAHLSRAADLYGETGDARGHGAALENLGRLSRLQGEYGQAQSSFERALRVFTQVGDRQGESRALQCLGLLAINQGNYAAAEGYLGKALDIAGETGDRETQSSLLGSLGVLENRRCQYGPARVHFEQWLEISREIGNRDGEAVALTNLGIILYCQGDYGRAAAYAEQAGRLSRQIGDRRYEGWALHTLGRAAARQGDYTQAQSHYEQGLAIGCELGDRQLEAVLFCSLGLLAHDAGDDHLAQEYARKSWSIAQEIGELVDVGYALNCLGRALAGLGEVEGAVDAYRQALDLRRGLGQASLAMESLAGLAELALARGDLSQARAHAEEIVRHLDSGTLDGAEEPLWVLLTCYRVLRAAHDPRAGRMLRTAHGLLQEQAAQIGGDDLRRSFLEGVVVHREIAAAYRNLPAIRGAAEEAEQRLTVSLPRADAPLGRPLRPEEHVAVTWTVFAPLDATACGKVARRRRLLRLLAEAQSQGAAPRDEDLAAALQVSLATLRRDMAALRRQGHALPTRRRKMST